MSDSEDEAHGGAEEGNIEIYMRIKPTANPTKKLEYDVQTGKVEFHVPRDATGGLVNNTRESYEFHFNGVFGPEATQEAVFARVCRRAVLGALDGYNGTVFAYGQTGSGKTFTVSGGTQRYSDRGLVPRALELLFSELGARTASGDVASFAVRVSYLEIYNEQCYDLLGGEVEVSADVGAGTRGGYDSLPKVGLYEDDSGSVVLRGLALHPADSGEEALQLLFKGDSQRATAETAMNAASSRSHAAFIVHVELRPGDGTDVIRRAKLHIVDLAGSERVAKTGSEGAALVSESKHINLSLSYLEQVIVALQERAAGLARPHVPYRNSCLTSVLRDSLGGNCRTAMVATVAAAPGSIEEGVATCRFAQRVAMISNRAAVNEEVDAAAVIARLKTELREAREALKLARGVAAEGDDGEASVASKTVSAEEWDRLAGVARAYVDAPRGCPAPDFGGSLARVRALFAALKDIAVAARGGGEEEEEEGEGLAASREEGGTNNGEGTPVATAPKPPPQRAPAGSAPSGGIPAGAPRASASSAAGDAAGGSGSANGSAGASRSASLHVAQRDAELRALLSLLHGAAIGGGDGAQPGGAAAEQQSGGDGGGARFALRCPAAASPLFTAGDGDDVSSSSSGGGALNGVALRLGNAASLARRASSFEAFRRSARRAAVVRTVAANELGGAAAAARESAGGANACRQRIVALTSDADKRAQQAAAATASGDAAWAASAAAAAGACASQLAAAKEEYRAHASRLAEARAAAAAATQRVAEAALRAQADFETWLASAGMGGSGGGEGEAREGGDATAAAHGARAAAAPGAAPPPLPPPAMDGLVWRAATSAVEWAPPQSHDDDDAGSAPGDGGSGGGAHASSAATAAAHRSASMLAALGLSTAAPGGGPGGAGGAALPPPRRVSVVPPPSAPPPGAALLSGDDEADADIRAFFQARERLAAAAW